MDVISLHQHGWTQVVAPLGTAFTENQLQILWHMCDEPIMCFDGDSAGQHAMIRALNRALPLLVSGKSLKFAVLPQGMDPDDMMRQKSDDSWKNIIQNATSFVDVLWNDLLSTHDYSTPEKHAKLEKDALEKVGKIQNAEIRRLYDREIRNRLRGLLYRKQGRGQNIKIAAPQADDFLLASLYAYPQQLSVFSESLGNLKHFKNLRETALFNGWLDAVLQGIDPPMPDTEKALMRQIEMIRTNKSAEIVSEEVEKFISALQLKQLKTEFSQKQDEYLKTEDPEIKKQIDSLSKEIEDFLSLHDEE